MTLLPTLRVLLFRLVVKPALCAFVSFRREEKRREEGRRGEERRGEERGIEEERGER